MKRNDDFSLSVKNKLAERVAYICSNPTCLRITIGPSNVDVAKSIKSGIAAHICSASPGGPRFDSLQTSTQRQSISNGIWLCGTCSIMIDKNNGVDYSVNDLKIWKSDFETLVKDCLEGKIRVSFQNKSEKEFETCKKIFKFLEQRGALYMDLRYEVPYHVFDSAKEIRTFLTQIHSEITVDSSLEFYVDSINHACRYFMNTTNGNISIREMAYSLGAMRKIIGINLSKMQVEYKINLKGPIRNILPK